MHKRQKHVASTEVQPLLTIEEVAAILNIGRTTVYGYIQREGLPAIPLAGRGKFRVRRSSLERWLEAREQVNE
jgi:excisionase family DNA binding protein